MNRESIELGLGQIISSLRFDRVLGRQHQKWRLDRIVHTVDRDASLLHDLEQGRVRLGRCPVDLVGQQQLGEDGPRAEPEIVDSLVEDGRTRHVRRHQVGGELNAVEPAAKHPTHRPDQKGLPQPRHALDQHVPIGQEREQDPAN